MTIHPSGTMAVRFAATLLLFVTLLPCAFGDGEPSINWPKIIGFSPGHPVIFDIPASGDAPLTFKADDLPPGLSLDSSTGVITGSLATPGTSTVTVTVSNASGSAKSELTLICGVDKLAQTPPMGWSANNVFGVDVTDEDIRNAADLLVSTGLASHGYQYIWIGDSWEGKRGTDGEIEPNDRFPDMKALADYVHSKGLKLGLYSAATAATPSGFIGSKGSEQIDAATFAKWGIDYLTYDWSPDQSEANIDPNPLYQAMGKALSGTDRDIVYGIRVLKRMSEPNDADDQVFEARNGLYDDISLISQDAQFQANVGADFGPGHWISHGPLYIGRYGYPDLHLSRLTSGEQMIQLTLWSMFSAPLILSCDLKHLDPNLFNHDTSNVLMNDEVLAIDQDPAAKAPVVISSGYGMSVWSRQLGDGRYVVAFVNTTGIAQGEHVNWSDLNISGSQPVRDLWNHQDLPPATDSFSALIPADGVTLVEIGKATSSPGQ